MLHPTTGPPAFFSVLLITIIALGIGYADEAKPNPDSEDPFSDVTVEIPTAKAKNADKSTPEELSEDPFETDSSSIDPTKIDGALLDPKAVQSVIKKVRPAIVKVTHLSRDGGVLGSGSGFVISEKGLIATNHHVIGTARPIQVELYDGTKFDVTDVHAWDRRADLAVLKINPGKHPLTPLKLGEPGDITQGQAVLGFGNPRGLKFSVVSGLVSAVRHLEDEFAVEGGLPDFPLIQLAMPIEMGNSGGPIVDLNGTALGIVTIKHMVTPNLGFAVPIEHLQPLLDKPNQVPMEQWKTIGALDEEIWTNVMGARWTQRGGVINVEGLGGGFGGRALCLSEREVPDRPFDIAVQVKLDDESGAAGLVFASDGSDKHYGFYPSGGSLRLTRFEGPDVYSWTILQQIKTDAYRSGEWNHLRIRINEEKIEGYVNDEKVLDTADDNLRGGQVGLCKFRGTVAEFRNFRIGKDLAIPGASAEVIASLNRQIDAYAGTGDRTAEFMDELTADMQSGRRLLLQRADELEARANAMRQITHELHLHEVVERIKKSVTNSDDELDLFAAALLISQHDHPDLDIDFYQEEFDRLVKRAGEFVEKGKGKKPLTDREKAIRLSEFLFQKSGFHGGRSEYYHPGNSYLNEVLDYREGLPISLSVLFIESARRLGISGVGGVPLPGHFLVGHFNPEKKKNGQADLLLFDVFEGGRQITRQDAENIARSIARITPSDDVFQPAKARDILVRMLRNLIGLEMSEERPEEARGYIELVLAISPEESQERFQRAILRYQSGNHAGSKEDIEWLLDRRPMGLDYDRLGFFLDRLQREMAQGKK